MVERNQIPTIHRINSSLAIIATDNFEHNRINASYPPMQDKIWQIWVPKKCRMILYISHFDVLEDQYCADDFFAIQQKRYRTVVKYCGGEYSLPKDSSNKPQIVLTKRRVQFTFRSSYLNKNGKKGLHATFCFQNKNSVTRPGCSCNINTTKTKRRRRTSNYHLMD